MKTQYHWRFASPGISYAGPSNVNVAAEWNRSITYACNHRRVEWLKLKPLRRTAKGLQAEFRKLPGGKRPDWLERSYAHGPAGIETLPAWRGDPKKWR
jgi:hypothetical protein